MKKMFVACVITSLFTLIVGQLTTTRRAMADQPAEVLPSGYQIKDIRFGEGANTSKALPQVPRPWKLVSISGGEQESELWFRDGDGNLFEMSGFNHGDQFTVYPTIFELHAQH
jgi:hypothetical protein